MKNCRFCHTELKDLVVSLGPAPYANSYLKEEDLGRMEPFYPLDLFVCKKCFLVQLDEFESPEEIFGDYAYFSSYSDSWLLHCKEYTEKMIPLLGLGTDSLVVEVASNDGYLLQYFKDGQVPVLGIEPAANVAEVAREKAIPTEVAFFGSETARRLRSEGKGADLLLGNNVLAHVPDLNDFVVGLKILLNPGGVLTMEFPHLLPMLDDVKFDTIYHEHFSYFSFITAQKVFAAHDLTIFDVEILPTHGTSLRIYVRHTENDSRPITENVTALKRREEEAGLTDIGRYLSFSDSVNVVKRNTLKFLIKAKEEGKMIAGYGAPAKGNTFLSYLGAGVDFFDYTVDRSPAKQGKYLPGSHIPIKAPEMIFETKPDYLFIFPWNLKDEIMGQMDFIDDWGGRFVTAIPKLEIS